MALLGRIRQYGVLMMVLIVTAVFGFLFMDVSSMGRGFGGPSNILGSVNGIDITRDDFEEYISDYERMGAKNDEQTRAFAWKEIVTDMIFKIQSKKLGINISDKELEDMYLSDENPSSVFIQALGGQADRATREQQRNQYLQISQKSSSEMNDKEREFLGIWKTIEKRAIVERMSSKYINMLSKSNYSPTWLTNSEYTRNNRMYDFNYVRVMFADVPNSEVKVSDEEMKSYIKENAKKYEREANVSLDYVIFDVFPTAEDTASYEEKMKKVAEDFKVAQNDTTFVGSNRGKIDFKFTTKADFMDGDTHKVSIFGKGKGDVYGPYMDNAGNFKVVKIVETKDMPDSVKCRQIFRAANRRDMGSLQQHYTLLDSLRTLLKANKANFDSLVVQNTMDGTSRDNGGNIGWRKKGDAYGASFEDYIFHVGKKDSFEIIQSDEGLHLVQITEVRTGKERGLKLAVILEPIIPSTKTEDMVESKANEFMANNRKLSDIQEAVKKNPSLKKLSAYGIQLNDFRISEQITGSIAVEMIRWANKEAKVGEVAGQVFPVSDPQGNYVSKVVVPALVSKSAKGLATIEDPNVKQEVELAVRNKKKAEIISKKLAGSATLEAASSKYNGAKIETASSVSYASPFVPGLGVEPKVLGTADALEVNKVSAPIIGTQGVYMIQVTSKREGPAMTNLPIARKSVSEKLLPADANQVRELLSEALKDKLKVKDKRADSY